MGGQDEDLGDFGLFFDLKGTARQGLKDMAMDLTTVLNLQRAVADGFGRMNAGPGFGNSAMALRKVNDELKHLKENTDTGLLALKSLADGLNNSFENTIHKLKSLGSEAVGVAADVEASREKLSFSARKMGIDAEKQAKQLDAAGLKTLQTTQDLYDMASSLNLQKVNIFDKALDDLTYMDKTGKAVKATSAEILADAASMSARGPQQFMFGLREAVSAGKVAKGHGLSASLDLPENFRKRYNTAMSKVHTQQEKFNVLVKELAKDYGGTAAALGNSFKFMQSQIQDFKNKIYYELLKDVLPKMTAMLKAGGTYLTEFIESGKLDPIRKQLTSIYEAAERVAISLARGVKKIMEFTSTHPQVIKYAAAFIATTVAMKGVLSMLSKLGVTAQGLKFAFEFIGNMSKTIKGLGGLTGIASKLRALMAPFAPVFLKLGIIAGAVAMLARLLVGGTTWADTWDRVRMVFEGISEGISNMNNGITTMSMDTALKLKKAGMFEFVTNFLRIANRIGTFVKGVFAAFDKYGPRVWANIVRIRDNITQLIDNLLIRLGVTNTTLGESMTGTADSSIESWERFGTRIGELIGLAIEKFSELIAFVTDTLAWLDKMSNHPAFKAMGYLNSVRKAPMNAIGYVTGMGGEWVDDPMAGNDDTLARMRAMKSGDLSAVGGSAGHRMAMNNNGKVDVQELENMIARRDGPKGQSAQQMDYAKLKEAMVEANKLAPAPNIYLNGKKVTDGITEQVLKDKKLAE